MNSFILIFITIIFYLKNSSSQNNNVRKIVPFNVDLEFSIEISNRINKLFSAHRSPQLQSMFGSSITADNNVIFIGAPKMLSSSDPRLITGAAFRCDINLQHSNNLTCREIDFRSSIRSDWREYIERNNSMIGYSMLTSKKNVLICAPTYVTNSDALGENKDLTPEGLCFELEMKRPSSYPILVYFEAKDRVLNRRPLESHLMLGFSLINDENTNFYLMGIPGLNDLSGGFATAADSKSRLIRSNSYSPSDSYAGYAMAMITSKYDRYLAIGAPRASKFTGKVMLISYDDNMNRIVTSISSPETGSGDYFGSVLAVNTNRIRNFHDLFVGAPLHSDKNRRQTGRVYCFSNIVNKLSPYRLDNPDKIQPKIRKAKAQFGSAIAFIDLNRDGFNDVVISAPYEENENSLGSLYFYYYEKNHININSEVRIEPKNVGSSLKGFGFSIWTGSDLDNNGFNDLIVGSALSEHVTILRTKPVITLDVTMKFEPKGINLTNNKNCNGKNACFRAEYCIITNAKQNFVQDLTYLVNFTVSDRKLRSKLTRVTVPKQKFIVRDRKSKICNSNQQFYVELKDKDDIFDASTPIEVEMSVALEEQASQSFCSHCPVAQPVIVYKEINFEHGCAQKKCISKLYLNSTLSYGSKIVKESIIQGIYNNVELSVLISNKGEASIDTYLVIHTNTPGLSLRNSETRCRTIKVDLFHCDVNRFLFKDQHENFKIFFDFENIENHNVIFNLELKSQSSIAEGSIIKEQKRISVIKEATFKLHADAHYNFSFSTQSPIVSFPISLLVDKKGPSQINSSVVSFLLPYDIISIDPISRYRCYRIDSISTSINEYMLHNGTLILPCEQKPEMCRRFECTVGSFKSESQTQNLDLSLMFQSTEIPSKFSFQEAIFTIEFQFYSRDPLIDSQEPFASSISTIIFEKQATAPIPKSNPLIMIGGGGVGLFIILITVFFLIKAGFFKRKRREQMLRAKARMSMAPNLANLPNIPDPN